MIIYYEVNTIYGKKRIQAEIQIRTLAMNFWATVEHSLQYKYKGDIPQHVTDKLLVASDAIDVLDHEMSTVRDEIMDAQDSFRKKSNLVSEILHTMQNLYKVANRHEVLKIQEDVYKRQYMIRAVLEHAGQKTGLIGTIETITVSYTHLM